MWTSLRLAHQPACTCYQQPSFKKTMQKIHITLLIILSSVFFSTGAVAQNKPLACYEDAKAGLDWKNGRWVTSTFAERRFTLVQTKDGLTNQSVAKALGVWEVSCKNTRHVNHDRLHISCIDSTGGSFYFFPETLKGAISEMWGATTTSTTYRDQVSVSVFSCTPF